MIAPVLVTICSASSPIRVKMFRTSSGIDERGYRKRACLATCSARSPMRSSDAAMRRAPMTARRSDSSRCSAESRSRHCRSMSLVSVSISASASITDSAVWRSESSSAPVALRIAEPTRVARRTSSSVTSLKPASGVGFMGSPQVVVFGAEGSPLRNLCNVAR